MEIYTTLKSDEQINEHIKCPNLSTKCAELMKILDDNIVLAEAAKIGTVRFDVNIFKRGIFVDLDNCEKQYEESKDELECLRLYLERFIIKYKGKKTKQMIKIHETDKNGLFLSMTGNRSKILKEALKKIEIYQGNPIKYTSSK